MAVLQRTMYVVVEFVDEETIAVSHLYWIETEDQVSFIAIGKSIIL